VRLHQRLSGTVEIIGLVGATNKTKRPGWRLFSRWTSLLLFQHGRDAVEWHSLPPVVGRCIHGASLKAGGLALAWTTQWSATTASAGSISRTGYWLCVRTCAGDHAIDAVSTSAWHLCNAQTDDPVRAAENFSRMLDEAHLADHSER
jgi:hypothetical protein